MKKTIAALALVASSNALAIAPPPGAMQPEMKTVCFKVTTVKSGKSKLMYAGCDQSHNNQRAHLENLENGCPVGQVALTVSVDAPIHSCMPPGMIQL